MSIKKLLSYVILTSVIILSGCSTGKDAKKLKIGTLNTADSVPLFVAKNDGLFEENNVDVELVEFFSASDQSKAVEAGQIDGMMTDIIVPSLIRKGNVNLDIIMVALGEDVSQGKFTVAASSNSDYADKDSIEGGKVAISEGTMMEFLVDSYCEELGIDINKIKKVNVPSLSLRLEMLLEGKDIDLAILPEPLAQFAELNGAVTKIDDTKLNVNLSQSVITINEKFIAENRDTVKGFVKAYNEAVDNLNNNPDKYRELLLKVAKVPEGLQDSYVSPVYPKNAITDAGLFDKVQNWMVNKGLLEKPYSYDEMVDSSFVKE